MLLKDWIIENNYTSSDFADKIGYTRSRLSLLINKKTRPTLRFAKSVESATENDINHKDVMDGSCLGGKTRRGMKRKEKLLPKNAISFL